MSNTLCYCGSGVGFSTCCEPIIQQQKRALTAEQLMRSRFSAFYTHHRDWLFYSWDSSTRPHEIDFDDSLKWFDLTILNTQTRSNEHSTVEFEARYFKAGKMQAIHENSRFIKRNNEWFYVDGDYL